MDRFDSLLIHSCTVLSNDSDPEDTYGQESRPVKNWDIVTSGVKCRLSTDSIGRPHEFKTDIKVSVNYRRIFMRPPTLSNGQQLNTHHALLLNGATYYNIFEVMPLYDATALHHLEVIVEEIVTLAPGEFGS